MHNLLIVDDEINVVNGLAYDVAWEEIEIEEVHRATSTDEAIAVMTCHRVDVVIADIRMPGVDGLLLADILHKQWPLTRVILLSGCAVFDYAQTAIQTGVFAYLTKPVQYSELLDVVKNALISRTEALRSVAVLEDANTRWQEALPQLRERALTRWIVNDGAPPWADSRFKRIDIDVKEESSATLVLVRQEKSDPLLLEHTARQMLLREGLTFWDAEDNLMLVTFNDVGGHIASMAEAFQESIGNDPPSIYWEEVRSSGELPNSYRRLREKARREAFFGTIAPVSGGDALIDYGRMQVLMDTLQKDALLEELTRLFNAMDETMARERAIEIYYFVCSLAMRVAVRIRKPLKQWAAEWADDLLLGTMPKTASEIFHCCYALLSQAVEAMTFSEEIGKSLLVQKAKDIIFRNYHRELTLSEIAGAMYVHPNYLSRLFSMQENISISRYITHLRIEDARMQLSRPGVKVYEIADELGYKSVAHFNRMFKKETGLSPTEYRDRCLYG